MQIEGSKLARTTLYACLAALLLTALAPIARAQQPDTTSLVLPSRESTPAPESAPLDVLSSRRMVDLPSGALPVRAIDGGGNNLENPHWGRAGVTLLRRTSVDYADGLDAPAAPARASAREISNLCSAQRGAARGSSGVSSMFWQWGQFLDHDIDLVPVMEPREDLAITVPSGDRFFDPDRAGDVTIRFERSLYRKVAGRREQVNAVTAFIDASQVYGSDVARANALRAMDGSGRLATSPGDLLPFNRARLENAPTEHDPSFFLAGDVRANEQVGLIAMHTLFVREHNWWAERIREESPALRGDEIYEQARMMVAAEMQAITYREFLPQLLGPNALAPYAGYDPSVDPGIANVFATAAYRFGHSMLPSRLLRLDAEGREIPEGHLSLADAFFDPVPIRTAGIEPVLRGLVRQRAERVDTFVVDAVRNFLFGGPRSGGFDLAALNIQRGRDHGLPSYNLLRADVGRARAGSFSDVNGDPQVVRRLAEAYSDVDDIDAWVGGLSEPPAGGALVGETWRRVLADQFRRLRDGDRFWYQSHLPPELVSVVESQTLATIIRRNTDVGAEIPDEVFRAR